MSTKIFCDIAELDQIKKFNKKKIVKGFTTNPSLMRKAGAKNYKSYSKKILKICDNKPISLEVFADEYNEMKIQAMKINTCLLYTSDAADEEDSVDLGGRRIIKKK